MVHKGYNFIPETQDMLFPLCCDIVIILFTPAGGTQLQLMICSAFLCLHAIYHVLSSAQHCVCKAAKCSWPRHKSWMSEYVCPPVNFPSCSNRWSLRLRSWISAEPAEPRGVYSDVWLCGPGQAAGSDVRLFIQDIYSFSFLICEARQTHNNIDVTWHHMHVYNTAVSQALHWTETGT